MTSQASQPRETEKITQASPIEAPARSQGPLTKNETEGAAHGTTNLAVSKPVPVSIGFVELRLSVKKFGTGAECGVQIPCTEEDTEAAFERCWAVIEQEMRPALEEVARVYRVFSKTVD